LTSFLTLEKTEIEVKEISNHYIHIQYYLQEKRNQTQTIP